MESLTSNLSDDPLVTSWVWGKNAGNGKLQERLSPVDGSLLGQTHLLTDQEIKDLLEPLGQPFSVSSEEVQQFAKRLHAELGRLAEHILDAFLRETGFIRADCAEMLEGTLLYARDFFKEGFAPAPESPVQKYEMEGGKRAVQQIKVPWGTVAVVLPANSALFLAVTCLLNALVTGNRVILRFPSASPISAALLCEALSRAKPPANSVSVVMAHPEKLMNALQDWPASVFIHYLGSSRNAPSLITQGFDHGKAVIADGEGNTWVWVSSEADAEFAAQTLINGAIRYNGQTCTSINGALIHPDIYNAVRDKLIERWSQLRVGAPHDDQSSVGPLSDIRAAAWCTQRIASSGGRILCGGTSEGNFLIPTMVENPSPDSELVTQGLFGPALWIAQGDEEEFVRLWTSNQFPLCAGVLAPHADGVALAGRLDNVARLVLNGDPSLEWTFEPWGGYPSSGNNPISSWADKYRRVVALDVSATA